MAYRFDPEKEYVHIESANTIQLRILYVRQQSGASQNMMAEKLRVHKSHISNLERGVREASDMFIAALCNEFSVNETWLRTGKGEPFFNSADDLQKTFASGLQRLEKGIQKLEEMTRPRALVQLRVGRFFVGLFCDSKTK